MKLRFVARARAFVPAGILYALAGYPGSLALMAAPGATNAPAAAAPPPASVELDKDSGKPITTTPSGLKYVDLVAGKGDGAKTGDHLSVNYVGKLADGTKFDSSYDRGQPFDVILGESHVIQGWTEGLAGMKAGGKRKLIIPPQLGYGLTGYPDVIPPNATLIFEIELVSITK
jgi:peptidylprolyl isomerase